MKTVLISCLIFLCNPFVYLHADEEASNGEEKADNSYEQKETEKKTSEGASVTKKEEEKPFKIGNLALPPSQQPNPLISFGQNVLEKNQKQGFVLATDFIGHRQYFINANPSILYGFTDELTAFITAPFAVRYKQDGKHSSGGGDVNIQLEYAFYTKSSYTWTDQATFVTNITIPTGSRKKNPPTGLGANSFFFGGTYSRTGIEWIYFVSSGAILNASSHQHRFGDAFLYQCGVGRNIANLDDWLFLWMVEFDGQYIRKDKNGHQFDNNTGGNIIYITPSLWISSTRLILQLGIGFPVLQQLNGHQHKNDYLLALNAGWLF